jgi:hypothetical protein
MIVRSIQYDTNKKNTIQTSINQIEGERDEEHEFGCRLVGIIPVSDAFGIDLIIERYTEQSVEFKKQQDEKNNQFMKSNPDDLQKKYDIEMQKLMIPQIDEPSPTKTNSDNQNLSEKDVRLQKMEKQLEELIRQNTVKLVEQAKKRDQ